MEFNIDFLDNAPYGAYVVDFDQTILYWNSGAERILGHLAENMVGKHCYEVLQNLHPEHSLEVCLDGCSSILAAREGRLPGVFQLRMLSASRERRLVTLTPMVIPTGSPQRPIMVHLFHEQHDEDHAMRIAGAVEGVIAAESSTPQEANQDENNPLTDRELEVMRLMATGLSNRDIAAQLGVSYHTVRNHVSSIRGKLSVKRRNEAARIGRILGLGQQPITV